MLVGTEVAGHKITKDILTEIFHIEDYNCRCRKCYMIIKENNLYSKTWYHPYGGGSSGYINYHCPQCFKEEIEDDDEETDEEYILQEQLRKKQLENERLEIKCIREGHLHKEDSNEES